MKIPYLYAFQIFKTDYKNPTVWNMLSVFFFKTVNDSAVQYAFQIGQKRPKLVKIQLNKSHCLICFPKLSKLSIKINCSICFQK